MKTIPPRGCCSGAAGHVRLLLPAERDLDVYLLGPRAFMQSCYASLRALGVAAERIRYEFFGPLEALEEASA